MLGEGKDPNPGAEDESSNTLSALTLIAFTATSAAADTLTAPTGDVLLRISGAIAHENVDGTLSLDLEQLKAMETREFTTSTIWMEDEVTFTGVSLRALREQAGAEGTAINASALNDYKVVMPLSDVESDVPIIATRMNGAPMSVRDKGPYWIVFPYDQDARYQTETIYSYSIWQLNRLNVVD